MNKEHSHCLHPLSFGLAGGILWGLSCFLLGLLAVQGYGEDFVKAMGSFYIGYRDTMGGSFVGLLWGFLDGLIGCTIFAWIYNVFCSKLSHLRLNIHSKK